MFRTLFRFILLLVFFAIARSVVVTIMRAVSQAMRPGLPRQPAQSQAVRSAGDLIKDPVCGTFVAEASSVKKTVNGEVVHFCSAACRDRYKAA
jgi:YHS domain-containing protein